MFKGFDDDEDDEYVPRATFTSNQAETNIPFT